MELKMRQIFFALVLILSFSWVSASDGKIKEISSVEDVKEMRESRIERLTKRLSQDGLDEKKRIRIEKRIAMLKSKPLPSQKQIDWRKEHWRADRNRSDRIRFKGKGPRRERLSWESFPKQDAIGAF